MWSRIQPCSHQENSDGLWAIKQFQNCLLEEQEESLGEQATPDPWHWVTVQLLCLSSDFGKVGLTSKAFGCQKRRKVKIVAEGTSKARKRNHSVTPKHLENDMIGDRGWEFITSASARTNQACLLQDHKHRGVSGRVKPLELSRAGELNPKEGAVLAKGPSHYHPAITTGCRWRGGRGQEQAGRGAAKEAASPSPSILMEWTSQLSK